MHSNQTQKQEKLIDVQTLSRKWNFLFIPLLMLIIYLYPVKSFLLDAFYFGSLIPVLIVLLIWGLLIFMRLRIEITTTEIKYRLSPFHLHTRRIEIRDLNHVELVSLDAFSEFGGWGIRYNPGTKTTGYIIKGDKGILLIKKTGKRILLTTTLPSEKLHFFINSLNSVG